MFDGPHAYNLIIFPKSGYSKMFFCPRFFKCNFSPICEKWVCKPGDAFSPQPSDQATWSARLLNRTFSHSPRQSSHAEGQAQDPSEAHQGPQVLRRQAQRYGAHPHSLPVPLVFLIQPISLFNPRLWRFSRSLQTATLRFNA